MKDLKVMFTTSAHKLIMITVLKEIYSDLSLGTLLGFKGGSASYFFHKLPRFSVDLDFDLLDASKKDLVFSKISKIAKKHGEVRESREKYYNLFWLISYKKGGRQLKIEINKRGTRSSYEVKSYLGVPMKIMIKEDIFAHKLEALLERKRLANRDIFDTWYMLKGLWDINWSVIGIKISTEKKKFLKRCIDLLEKNPPESILSGLGELLDNKQKAWVKENLIKDTIFHLRLYRENLEIK